MVRRCLQFSYEKARLILAGSVLITVFLGYQASRLQIDVSVDGLIPRHSEAREVYEKMRDTFGSDKAAAVYVEDPRLFTAPRLLRLRTLHEKLSRVRGIERVSSLFSYNLIQGGEGWIESGPLLDFIPQDPEEIRRRLEEAVTNPLLCRNVISKDGKATLFTLYLEPVNSGPVKRPAGRGAVKQARAKMAEILTPAEVKLKESRQELQIYREVEELLGEFRSDFEAVFQTGTPSIHVQMAQYIKADQRFLIPLALLIIVLLFGLILQNGHAALIPMCDAVLATVWTLGLLSWMGVPINMLNYIVPVLIVVIGASQDIHLISEFRDLRAEGRSKEEAIALAGKNIGLTLLLTCLTTAMGFAVTSLTALPMMRDFALSASLGIGCRFLATLFVLPVYLRFLYPPGPAEGAAAKPPYLAKLLADKLTGFILHVLEVRPILVVLLFLTMALPCFYYASGLRLNNDLLSFIKQDSPIVRRIKTLRRRLAGTDVIYIVLDGWKDRFKSAASLQQMAKLCGDLSDPGRFPELDTVTSLAGLIQLANREIQGGKEEDYRVPHSNAAVAQYLLFMHPSDLKPYVTYDFSRTNIVLRTHASNSTEMNRLIRRLRGLLKSREHRLLTQNQRTKKHTFEITGKSVLVASAVDKIAAAQAASLGCITALLFTIVAILFLSFRLGLLALLSNLFHVAALFGVMGFAGVPLNVGTCMVAAITVGIGVDDTLHLLVRYNRKLRSLKDEKTAVAQTLRAEMLPVLATSLGLACGFVILGFSSFVPVQQFGLLSALVILIALASDVLLTPVLLSFTKLVTIWDLLSLQLRKNLMENSRLFRGMSGWHVKKIILLSRMAEYEVGAQVLRDGEMGNEMFVVLEGELEVSKMTHGRRVVLSRLAIGDIFGEVALIVESRRTADVYALSDTKLLKLDWKSVEDLQKFSPFLAAQLYLNLARILGLRLVQSSESYTLNPWRQPKE